ncbi:hypothetical protein [Pararhodobacter aggregans]|uniref:hypothetical protein n=1 Tax=Pararhodobacter aggregans TaxID=404875 RepID=UPI003A9342E8
MRIIYGAALAQALCFGAMPALAQSGTETVTLTMEVNQPSLFDTARRDVFRTVIDDRSGTTTLNVECSAGTSALFGLSRTDEACAVSGSGVIKNPNNPSQSVPRVDFAGGFTISGSQDGFTDMRSVTVGYRRVGSAPQEATTFGGNLVMMPESPSASAMEIGRNALAYLQQNAAGSAPVEYDTRIDSISFNNFAIPHVGQANATGCTWNGDWVYSYAAESWNGAFDVTCGNTRFRLEGNMSLGEAPAGSDHDEEYVVNLVIPGEGGSGGDPFAAPDPFATVDGITGTLAMSNSGRATQDGVYTNVAVTGQLVGTNVPLEAVRGWGQIVAILGRAFMGE